MRNTIALIVLDGWGIGPKSDSNPIHVANPETFAYLDANFPHASLEASGIAVGLPWGEVGNSEVGHLTLGAGKTLFEHYPRITLSIQDGSFFENPALKDAYLHAKKNNSAVNLAGLLSKAHTHSALEHLRALIKMGEKENVRIRLHLFADGKDTSPKSIVNTLKEIPNKKIATLVGRYYAMDREENWQLTKAAYDTLVGFGGRAVDDPLPVIEQIFEQGLSEEYLPPLRIRTDNAIQENDALIFFNFREDSMRELAECFLMRPFSHFPVKDFKNLYVATMTQYEEKLAVPVAFSPERIVRPLGLVLEENSKTQLRLAETYKYAHVTYFFNGYREQPFKNEYRVLIPSIQTPKPEAHPEMMAGIITERALQAIATSAFDFLLVNYANPDTMGHTGNFDAALRAVTAIDRAVAKLLKATESAGGTLIITSDHGNVERMFDPATGRAESQHDPNPVPLYIVGNAFKGKRFQRGESDGMSAGTLADVAPTILELLGLRIPKEMTGHSLLRDIL